MLSSTAEYLQALREDKYLLFLEWPQFVSMHYQKFDAAQDADTLVKLLVCEWLRHGFLEKDMDHLALLSAVQDRNPSPLKGNLSYALTAISVAAFQSMVYCKSKLDEVFLKNQLRDEEHIKEFTLASLGLDEHMVFDLLQKEHEAFDKRVATIDSLKIGAVVEKISAITELRYLLDDYLLRLERDKSTVAPLKITRLSLAKRLFQYLNEQFEMTDTVRKEITHYVAQIREMGPADFEEEYLGILSPLSFVESSWRLGSSLALSVFHILLPPEEEKTEVNASSSSLDKCV